MSRNASLVHDLVAQMSTEERIRVVVLYFKHGESMPHVRRSLRRFYGNSGTNVPHERVLLTVVQLFCDTGSVLLGPELNSANGSSVDGGWCTKCSLQMRPNSSSAANSVRNHTSMTVPNGDAPRGASVGATPQRVQMANNHQHQHNNNGYSGAGSSDTSSMQSMNEAHAQSSHQPHSNRYEPDEMKDLAKQVNTGAAASEFDFDDLEGVVENFSSMPQVELSQFQKDKYSYLFYQFYGKFSDVDRNGVITHQDFKETLKALKKFRRWGLSDPRFGECEYVTRSAWNALKAADLDRDNKVSLEEWQHYWASFIHKSQLSSATDGWPSDVPWVKDFMNFWFDLMDSGGDGSLEEDEYVEVTSYYGVPPDSAKTCFKIFATQEVDREYFGKLWLQYMTSNDKSQPGNYVFGNCKCAN